MSSTVAASGMFTVLLMAPEMNGWTAAIMRTCPMGAIDRSPFTGLKAQSNTGRCSGFRPGAPSIVSCWSTWPTMASTSSVGVPQPPERGRHAWC